MPDSKSPAGSQPGTSSVAWWIWLLPFVFNGLVLFFSPNYQWSESGVRSAPYGGDFLQEWVGGQLILSGHRKDLYDPAISRSWQHDSERVGFEWPESSYFPMVYPPHHYLLFSPFSLLEYRWAVVVWALVSTIFFVTSGYLMYRFYPAARSHFLIWFLAASVFFPWLKCLTMGQKSSLILLVLTVTFLLQFHRRWFMAGIVFGLLAIKPQLALVIGAVMILKKQPEFVLGASLMVGTLVGLSWMYEPQLWVDYVQVVLGMGDYVTTGGYQLSESHSIWGATQMVFAGWDGTVVKAIAGGMAVLIAGGLLYALRGDLPEDRAANAIFFVALVVATVVLSPHFYTYDLTILLLPMLLVLATVGTRPSCGAAQGLLASFVAIYLFSGIFSRLSESTSVPVGVLFLVAALVASLLWLGQWRAGDGRNESGSNSVSHPVENERSKGTGAESLADTDGDRE